MEAVHAMIYFSPDAPAAYASVGVTKLRMGYFASRVAAMGAVPAAVVIATFYNFHPALVRKSMENAWTLTSPNAMLTARLNAVDTSLSRAFGDEMLHSVELAEAAGLTQRAALIACERPEGRPLFAAHAALPWSAPKLVVAHSCVLSWWAAVKGEPAPESWDRYRTEVRAGLAAADLVVAPSSAMLTALGEHYGPLANSRVIENGRDGRLFPASHAPKEEMVFAAGRLWDEAKNLAALERVAPEIPWPIYVAGESQHPGGGEIRPHNTRLLGRLSPRALAAWLGRAAIYALPARYEPFGLSALEAALAGCVLVLGDIPSLREIWRNRAVFVPPDDPAALRTALLSLIENPDRRNALAAGARARGLELTPERMLDGYLAAYGELLAARQEIEADGFSVSDALEPAQRIAV